MRRDQPPIAEAKPGKSDRIASLVGDGLGWTTEPIREFDL